MKLILHHALKDVRSLRWPLALWLTVLLVDVLVQGLKTDRYVFDLDAANNLIVALVTVGYVQMVFGWLLAARIVHADPLHNDAAFWLTRPMSARALLAAKLLLIGTAFLLLPCLGAAAIAAANGVRGMVLLRFVGERLALDTAMLLPVVVIATVTRDLARVVLVGVVAGLIYGVVHLIAMSPFPWVIDAHAHRHGMAMASGLLMAMGVSISASLLLIWHQFVTRQTKRTLALGAVAVVIAVAAGDFWPWSFWSATHFQLPAVDARVFDATAVRVSLADSDLRRGVASRGHIDTRGLVRVDGVPAGWVVRVLYGESRLRFPPEPTIYSSAVRDISWGDDTATGGDAKLALERALGTRIVNSPTGGVGWRLFFGGFAAHLLDLPEAVFQPKQNVPGEYDATIRLAAMRAQIGATIPLAPGASGHFRSVEVTIVAVNRPKSGGVVQVRETRPRLFLPWNEPDVLMVLRNRRTGESLFLRRDRQSTPGFGLAARDLKLERARLEVADRPAPPRVIDVEWMADAELVMVTLETVGSFEKQVKVSNFRLPFAYYNR